MSAHSLGLAPPNIAFDDDGAVRNLDYGDIYFSPEDGRAESTHVFLDTNQLAERFSALSKTDVFTIGELGFGTGLNFLLAWALFDECAPEGARLCFLSTELHPMSGAQIRRAMQPYPDLAARAEQLAGKTPPPVKGTHTLFFDHGRVRLSLLLGDVADTLPDAQAHVDAWFLDGFAPSRNAEMWADHVIGHVARLSHAGTSCATFTAAGAVRRALAAHGFTIEKVPGHGRKREMVSGRMENPPAPTEMNAAQLQLPPPYSGARRALVIGTGIAGSSTAHALAMRGWQVHMLDQRPALPPDAPVRQNLRGATYPKLGAQATPATRALLNGFNFTKQASDLIDNSGFGPCGILTLDFNDARAKRHDGISKLGLPDTLAQRVNASLAAEISGVKLDCGGLYMPGGGTIQPVIFCEALQNNPNIRITFNAQVADIKRINSEWQVLAPDGGIIDSAPVLVVAAGVSINALKPLSWIRAEKIRGQITMPPATPKSRALKCVLNHKGYVLPALNGIHIVGATFDKSRDTPDILPQDNAENLATLAANIPALADEFKPAFKPDGPDDPAALAGVRVAVNDRLPMAGPCPDYDRFLDSHAGLRKGQDVHAPVPLHEGLFVTGAHGSHGLSTAPLCGELIAAMLSGDPLPIELSLYEYLMPARMILRGLKRNEI